MKKILILGAGFGGLETATGLDAALDDGYEITLVDESESFFVGFSKIDVLFGRATVEEVSLRYEDLRAPGVRFLRERVTEIDTDHGTVRTSGHTLGYDYLVVALGAELALDAVPGFVESGGHHFYSMAGAEALAPVLRDFEDGTLVLGILGLPYKCPPAPFEVACQIHDYFDARGVGDRVDLRVVVPGPRPVGNPAVSELLEGQLSERGIDLVAGAPIRSVDAGARRVVTESDVVAYDLFLGVPVHAPPAVVRASKLSDGGFVGVDRETLETRIPGVYAVGDVTSIPVGDKAVPKAGAFAEDAARTVVSHILVREGFSSELVRFRARGACYVELGRGAVARVDADFLGGSEPRMSVSGPSADLRADKERFLGSRQERWFRTGGDA